MNALLAALVPGVLALIPVLFVPRRRRRLSLLKAEVDLLNVLPKATSAHDDITAVVHQSAADYFDRYISSDPTDVRRRRLRYAGAVSYGLFTLSGILLLVRGSISETFEVSAAALVVALLPLASLALVTWVFTLATLVAEAKPKS